MSGVNYLLDTNFVLGLVKGQAEVVSRLREIGGEAGRYGFSSITRMEALGFPGITLQEEQAISAVFQEIAYFPISPAIEDAAIRVRRQRRIKLPDAIIAATCLTHNLELLSLDRDLCNLVQFLVTQ